MVKLAGEKRIEALNTMTSVFTDALLGTKPLKVMGVGREFMQYVRVQADKCKKADKQYVFGVGFLTSVQEPVLTILLCLGLYVVTRHFKMDAALLLGMAFFFHRIVSRLSGAQQYWQIYQGQEGVLVSLMRKLRQIEENREQLQGEREVTFSNAVTLEKSTLAMGIKPFCESAPCESLTVL